MYLYVLSLGLVIQYVSDVTWGDLLSPRTCMDAYHGDSDRPGGVSYRHLQIGIISLGEKRVSNDKI